jgi:hypothetical protein
MSDQRQRGVCAYCGRKKQLTVDHIPPKLLLAEPFPNNLITVPACVECNKKFQRDDEYTRDMLALDFRAGANAAAASKVPKIFRSLQRPQSQRYAGYVQGQIRPTELVDSLGRPLSLRASPDRDRIDATGKHIMLGMHFHFANQPLPQDYQLYIHSKPGYGSIDFMTDRLTHLYEKAGAKRSGTVGNGFSYAAASFGDAFIYLFLVYEYFWWIVVALPAHVEIPDLPNRKSH